MIADFLILPFPVAFSEPWPKARVVGIVDSHQRAPTNFRNTLPFFRP